MTSHQQPPQQAATLIQYIWALLPVATALALASSPTVPAEATPDVANYRQEDDSPTAPTDPRVRRATPQPRRSPSPALQMFSMQHPEEHYSSSPTPSVSSGGSCPPPLIDPPSYRPSADSLYEEYGYTQQQAAARLATAFIVNPPAPAAAQNCEYIEISTTVDSDSEATSDNEPEASAPVKSKATAGGPMRPHKKRRCACRRY